MPSERQQYIRFMRLPAEWARQSGEPVEMVLRRLCEWTVVGAFPEHSLLKPDGSEVTPLSIFKAFQTCVRGRIELGSWDGYGDPDQATRELMEVLITADNVLAFCKATQTRPPSSVKVGFWSGLRREFKYLAPPPCPHAEQRAAQLFETETAREFLNSMRSTLSRLQGKSETYGPRRRNNDPVNFEHWEPRWVMMSKQAETSARNSGDLDLLRRVEELNSEWEAFKSEEIRTNPFLKEIDDVAPPGPEARLIIKRSQRAVRIGGHERRLSEKPLLLLYFLAEKAKVNPDFVRNQEIDARIWPTDLKEKLRPLRDVVRELRDQLAGDAVEAAGLRDLIETRKGVGYRLALKGEEIHFED